MHTATLEVMNLCDSLIMQDYFRKKDKDKYDYLSMKDFGEQQSSKRLRPCFYSPIQCLVKRRTATIENFINNYR